MLNPREAALLRGWAQGLALHRLAALYYDDQSSAATRRAIERLRLRLVAHARSHGKTEWADALGASAKDWSRRGEAVLTALRQIDGLPLAKPTLQAVPAQWLPPPLAKKLPRGVFATFGDLFDVLDRRGYDWWRPLSKFGPASARKVVQWLLAQGDAWGRAVPTDVLVKPLRRRAPVRTRAVWVAGEGAAARDLALVPLDRFVYSVAVAGGADGLGEATPARLDGVDGTNRALPIGEPFAANDYDAIQRWLATVADRANTYRTYRKEAERLLLWAVYQRGRALSSLDLGDAAAYRDFLAALDPDAGVAWAGRLARDYWIGPKNAARGQTPWRPFAGALSPRSQQHALTIVQSLFQFLVGQGYLWRNPFASVKGRTAVSMAVKTNHAFNAAQWQYLLAFLDAGRDALAVNGAAARDRAGAARIRFVIYLAYGTGLRLAELTAATLGDLKREPGEGLDDFYWVLKVVGKGNKPREVPLPDRVAGELMIYLRARGLPSDLKDCDGTLPLIDRVRRDVYELPASGSAKTTLAPSSIYRSLKQFYTRCAAALDGEGNSVAAERLRAASTHWLRHTHGTLGVRAGIRQSTMRDSLGHASLATTGIYLNDDLLERKREMEKLFAVGAGPA